MGDLGNGPARDPDVRAVLEALESRKVAHPRAKVSSYRQDSASIRIRVIAPDFRGLDRSLRHDEIWEIPATLPEKVQPQITMLLPLTRSEVKTSLANMDFENPIPSNL